MSTLCASNGRHLTKLRSIPPGLEQDAENFPLSSKTNNGGFGNCINGISHWQMAAMGRPMHFAPGRDLSEIKSFRE
jgi:hypothetical protein